MAIIMEASECLLLSTDLKKSESLWRDDPCFKFMFSFKGSMHYQSSRNDLTIADQEFIVFNPHDGHRQLAVDDHKFLVELDGSFLKEAAMAITGNGRELHFAQTPQKNPLIEQWVHFVQQFVMLEMESGNGSSEIFLEHSFAQLGLLLTKTAIGTHTADMATDPFRTVQPALVQVMAALKNDYQHAWTLDEMAAILGISKFQLAHLFKEKIGVSPYSWLQLYRLVRAQELLIQTNRSVTDIAYTSGFSSIGSFNQLFKRLYGFSPRMFRQCSSNEVK
ncbi:helix-turn-helix domain-containing protein [Planococcus sp. SSTMD024]|uniref:helix-turn-helix domain-containing protein n=1 Tax=Planococcus sp. SSTMD024 TaxID=3242163 RepID=UPI00351DD4D8